MPIEFLVNQCSPTLAGIKTGSLFSYPLTEDSDLKAEIREINSVIGKKGLRMIPLRVSSKSALIYVWRHSRLNMDFQNESIRRLLAQFGYTSYIPEKCIRELIAKLNSQSDFPHEIGLFLGYPPEDVEGFINEHAHNYLLCGTWKVYGDVEKARKQFSQFKACREEYIRRVSRGCSLDELTVSA